MHKHLGAFGVDEARFAKVLEADVDVGTGGTDYLGQDSGLILAVSSKRYGLPLIARAGLHHPQPNWELGQWTSSVVTHGLSAYS